jgi:ribonuclease D
VYVSDAQGLRELISALEAASVVAVDTEFMRERTYYARLCLIQVATDDVAAIIDPIALEDISPLRAILVGSSAVKVFHAGAQDLEIFYRAFGEAVSPVFDTQLAATLAGFPQQVGYGPLVKELLGVSLNKGDTYSDWARRPLLDTQVEYALNDVRYLPELYEKLASSLRRKGRLDWLAEDFREMEDPATYECIPEEQWRRLKRIASLNRRQLAVAREVAAWREIEAQRRDTPKRWVLGDESVVEIARRAPQTAEDLKAIRGVSERMSRSALQAILDSVSRGSALPESELPSVVRKRRPQGDVDGAVDLMVALVRLRAREHGVAMPLLASRNDLERLASGEREASPLLEGWRRRMVGDELLTLLDGSLEMRVCDGSLVVDKRKGCAGQSA